MRRVVRIDLFSQRCVKKLILSETQKIQPQRNNGFMENHQKGNIFSLLPKKLDREAFEPIVAHDHVVIERIVSRGHCSPETGWYDQKSNEWVMVLAGRATIVFENGQEVRLEKGDYVNISARTRHKVTWTDPGVETIWLTVHYG